MVCWVEKKTNNKHHVIPHYTTLYHVIPFVWQWEVQFLLTWEKTNIHRAHAHAHTHTHICIVTYTYTWYVGKNYIFSTARDNYQLMSMNIQVWVTAGLAANGGPYAWQRLAQLIPRFNQMAELSYSWLPWYSCNKWILSQTFMVPNSNVESIANAKIDWCKPSIHHTSLTIFFGEISWRVLHVSVRVATKRTSQISKSLMFWVY